MKEMKMQDINERLKRMISPPQQPRRPVLLEAMRIRRLMGMRPRGRGGVSWRPTEMAELLRREGQPPITPKPRFPFGGS